MISTLNKDVFQFEVCSFLDQYTLGNLACVSSTMKNDTADDDVVWHGSKRNCAINTLNKYIQKHYDVVNNRATPINMKIHSWKPDHGAYTWYIHTKREITNLDILERVLVRNIVRRNVPKENLIEILHKNDDPEQQFDLLRSIILKHGYIKTYEDMNDLNILIDISEYANLIRRGALYIYDSIASNKDWNIMNATRDSMHELRVPTKNYFGLMIGY